MARASALPRACIFDAYGTLFDPASAVRKCPSLPSAKAAELNLLWRRKQLQYTWLRTLQDDYADFHQVTSDALEYALESLGLAGPDLHKELMRAYARLDLFPEARPALEALRKRGIRTAILSNGTPAMLDALVEHAGITGLLDAVLSVDEVAVYKPHPAVYRLATLRFDAAPSALAFVSGNGWDAWAAAAFGMRAAWCNRQAEAPERLPGTPEWVVPSLAELPWL